MSAIQHNYSVLQKPTRTGIRKVRAQSMKPPQEVIDETGGENHEFFLCFVSDGTLNRVPCTKEIWKRVKGPAPTPGRKVPGLDHRTQYDFDIIFNPSLKAAGSPRGTVVDVDVIPKNKYERGLVPEALEGIDEITLKINQKTGSIEVIQLPPKIRDPRVSAVLNALDLKEVIVAGEEIAGCEVTAVSGNVVKLQVGGAD